MMVMGIPRTFPYASERADRRHLAGAVHSGLRSGRSDEAIDAATR